MAEIVSADDIKEKIEGYDPSKAEEFHRLSARLADEKFKPEIIRISFLIDIQLVPFAVMKEVKTEVKTP